MRLEAWRAMAEHNGAPRRAPLRPFLRDAVGASSSQLYLFSLLLSGSRRGEKVAVLNTCQAICFTICKQSETNIYSPLPKKSLLQTNMSHIVIIYTRDCWVKKSPEHQSLNKRQSSIHFIVILYMSEGVFRHKASHFTYK